MSKLNLTFEFYFFLQNKLIKCFLNAGKSQMVKIHLKRWFFFSFFFFFSSKAQVYNICFCFFQGKGRGRKAQAAKVWQGKDLQMTALVWSCSDSGIDHVLLLQMWMGSAAFPEGRCWTFELGSSNFSPWSQCSYASYNKTVGGESKLVSFHPCKKYDWVNQSSN